MSEWKEVKLGDVCEFKNGKKRPKEAGNIPVYGGNGILGYTNKFNNKKNAVIIGRVGAYCGNVYYVNNPIWVSDNAIVCLPKDKIVVKTIFYYLKHLNLNKYSIGSTQPLITQETLKNLKIKLPPLPIQKKIADILSVIDEKIEILQNINEIFEEMAKAIFKSWFVDFDIVKAKTYGKSDSEEIAKEFGISEEIVKLFPNEFETSEIGKIPKGWEVVYLKDEFKFERGVEPGSKWYIENPTKSEIQKKHLVPFYRVKDLDTAANIYIPMEVSKNKTSKFGDVLVSFDGTIGRVNAFLEGAYSSGIRKINASKYSNAFVYFLMKSDYIQDLIRKYATGTTILHAGKSINYLYLIKNDKIIKEYEKVIIPIFKTILSNTQQIQTLQNLRDTLLPKLINGEIEVDKLNIKGIENEFY